MASAGKPDLMRSSVASIDNASTILGQAAEMIAGSLDEDASLRLADYASRVTESVQVMVATAPRLKSKIFTELV